MKLLRYLPILMLLALGQVNRSSAAPVVVCPFRSQLSYTGTQWQVRSEAGPIYLARWESNSWHILAVFDGTNGRYYLNWEGPAKGIYVALDSFGVCSESLKIESGS